MRIKVSLFVQFLIGMVAGYGFFSGVESMFGIGVRFVTMLSVLVAACIIIVFEGCQQLKWLKKRKKQYDNLFKEKSRLSDKILEELEKSPENIKYN